MVVVKADGYGHGMVPVARAARSAGAEWLGVATAAEALALREAGDTGRVLSWLAAPGTDFAPLLEADVDVSAHSVAQLEEIVRACPRDRSDRTRAAEGRHRSLAQRRQPRGLAGRCSRPRTRSEQDERRVRVTGLWSHLACSDQPTHPANAAQQEAFEEALALADDTGLEPEVRHLANSAGALLHPAARYDLVRLGIAVYGLSPAPAWSRARRSGWSRR